MFKKNNSRLSVSSSPQLNINTVIAEELAIVGDLNGEESIRIDGRVKGNITIKEGVILGEKSFVEGNIQADSLIVFGKIIGNIICKSLQVKEQGIVNGDISTDTLNVEKGAIINGHLSMAINNNSPALLAENNETVLNN